MSYQATLLTVLLCSTALAARYDWPERYGEDHVVEIPMQPLYDHGRFCFGVYTTCRQAVVSVEYAGRNSTDTSEEFDAISGAVLFCSSTMPRGSPFTASLKCGSEVVVATSAEVPPDPPKRPILVGASTTERGWLKIEVQSDDDTVVRVYRLLRRRQQLGRTTFCRPCMPLMVTTYDHVRELTTRGGLLSATIKFEDPFDGLNHFISASTDLPPLERVLSTSSEAQVTTSETTSDYSGTTPGGNTNFLQPVSITVYIVVSAIIMYHILM